MAVCARFFHVNRSLIALKATVFLFYAAYFSLVPFLNLHIEYVGLGLTETTTVYAILLIASFAGPPIAGYITDKIGCFKRVLAVVLVGVAVSHNLLLVVPRVTTEDLPARSELLCTQSGSYLFTETCQLPGIHCPVNDGGDNALLDFRDCQFLCRDPNDTSAFPGPTSAAAAAVSTGTSPSDGDAGRPELCFFETGSGYKATRKCHPLLRLVSTSANNFSLGSAVQMYSSRKQCVYRVMNAFWAGDTIYGPTCPSNPTGCRLHCNVGLRRANSTAFVCTRRTGDPAVTFYVYHALRLVCFAFLGAAFSLMEAAILAKAKSHRGDYGKQRVWGNVAKSVIIPLVHYFTQVARNAGQGAYVPAFITFDILICLTLVMVMGVLELDIQAQPKLRLRDVLELLGRWDALLLYLAIFFLGAFWGFLDSYLPRFLLDLGSSKYLLDVSSIVGGLVCIPTMFFADTIMNKVGRVNILIAAFLCYAVQMLCYSLIGNPWWSVALEVLKFSTSCLKVASAVTLANNLAPRKLSSTMQGMIHCLQYLIGSGIGHLVGGIIVETYSARAALRVFGILSVLLGFVFGVTYYAIRKDVANHPDSQDANSRKSDPQFENLCHNESSV